MHDGPHYHRGISTIFSLHEGNSILLQISSSMQYYCQEAVDAGDIGIASTYEHILHHRRGVLLQILAACLVVIAASTEAVAAAAATELYAMGAWTAIAVAVVLASAAELELATVDYGLVIAWNPVSEATVARPAAAEYLPA